MFCADTRQELDKRTLDDKEGERLAVVEMLQNAGLEVRPGIVSGDAGIISPGVTESVTETGHGYILQIKGNSGAAFDEVVNLPWEKVRVFSNEYDEGHGREEIRSTKAIDVEHFDVDELDKYSNIGVVLQVERFSLQTATQRLSHEVSYYIGDTIAASLSLESQARYIRDHWAIESLHWIKDVVLKEDASFQRCANGSRILATVRSVVIKYGRLMYDSPKRFIDEFSANPSGLAFAL